MLKHAGLHLNKFGDSILKVEISSSQSFHQIYQAKRNEVNKLIKAAKIQYCKDNIEHYSKKMWNSIHQRIRGRLSKTTTITAIKDDLDSTIHDEKLIADQFIQIGLELLPASLKDFSEQLYTVDCGFRPPWFKNK